MGDFVVRQVRFSSAEGGGEHTFTVQLVPKSLGHVQLEVTTGQQGVSVHLITANPAAKEALEGQMSVLRDTLNKNGYEVNRLQVTSGQPGTSQFSFNQSAADSRTQNDGAPRLISGYPGAAASAADASGAAAKVARPNWHSGQLNVFV
jgi:flagellar hook-length control protein FliK